MELNQEESWEKFKTSGTVADYLAYKNKGKDNQTGNTKTENKK